MPERQRGGARELLDEPRLVQQPGAVHDRGDDDIVLGERCHRSPFGIRERPRSAGRVDPPLVGGVEKLECRIAERIGQQIAELAGPWRVRELHDDPGHAGGASGARRIAARRLRRRSRAARTPRRAAGPARSRRCRARRARHERGGPRRQPGRRGLRPRRAPPSAGAPCSLARASVPAARPRATSAAVPSPSPQRCRSAASPGASARRSRLGGQVAHPCAPGSLASVAPRPPMTSNPAYAAVTAVSWARSRSRPWP